MAKTEHKTTKRDPGKTIEVLFEISEAVSRTRNLSELYRVIHRSLDKILRVDNFYIALYDESADTVSFPYHVDERDELPEKIENFTGVSSSTGMVIKKRAPLIFYQQDIRKLARQLGQDALGSASKIWLGAPLVIKNRVIGAMVIQDYHSADAYQRSDLELLNSISQHVALAIERKESEEKIKSQRMVLEKILESSPVGIALVQNRVFKWVNREMVRMFGYDSKDDFQDKSVRMIYKAAEDFEFAGRTIQDSLTSKGRADYEIDLIKQDGSFFPAHIRLNSADADDPMTWTIATVTDISQRRTAEKETYERERLQGVLEMAGAVCHEINQPLQAILGCSELLLLGAEDNEADGSRLKSIKSQAARIGKITKKLSSITQYRTVSYPGKTQIVDIWQTGKDAGSRS